MEAEPYEGAAGGGDRVARCGASRGTSRVDQIESAYRSIPRHRGANRWASPGGASPSLLWRSRVPTWIWRPEGAAIAAARPGGLAGSRQSGGDVGEHGAGEPFDVAGCVCPWLSVLEGADDGAQAAGVGAGEVAEHVGGVGEAGEEGDGVGGVAAAIATRPEPDATSSTDRVCTRSGRSRMKRASACPPAQAKAQNGGGRPISPSSSSVMRQMGVTSSASHSEISGAWGTG